MEYVRGEDLKAFIRSSGQMAVGTSLRVARQIAEGLAEAHYRFGRVLEEKDEKGRARVEYEKFLKYWVEADPIHPELKDARARLARLKGS